MTPTETCCEGAAWETSVAKGRAYGLGRVLRAGRVTFFELRRSAAACRQKADPEKVMSVGGSGARGGWGACSDGEALDGHAGLAGALGNIP